MKSTIYKIVFNDGTIILTNDRHSIADEYNRIYGDKENFKKYNINTINGMLYNHNNLKKDIKSFERFSYRDYYKDYIKQYENTLNGKQLKKTYVRVRTNNVLNMIFDIESNYINNNKDKTEMEERIQQAINIH